MASTKPEKDSSAEARPAAAGSSEKDKKDKSKRSDKEGVHKSKKDKKEKKHKKEKLAQALDEHLLQASAAQSAPKGTKKEEKEEQEDVRMREKAEEGESGDEEKKVVIRGAMVEFALPLANEKHTKKIFKCVKKAAKHHAILRGVKEVNKALRKSPAKTPSTAHVVPGVVIIAGDISPAEVIMHLPLACEGVNVPYMFVASRAELGAAAKTKRPTSVVMLRPEGKKAKAAAAGKKDEGEGKKKSKKEDAEEDEGGSEDDYAEAYKELVKMMQKEYERQMKGLI